MRVTRYEGNPIIRTQDVKPTNDELEVIGVFNPGAVQSGDEVILLLRVAEMARQNESHVVAVPVVDPESEEIKVLHFPKESPDINLSDPRSVVYKGRTYLSCLSHLRVARSKGGIHFQVDDKPTFPPQGRYETYGVEDPRITALPDGRFVISYTAVSGFGICVGLAETRDFKEFHRIGIVLPPDNKNVAVFPEKVNGSYIMMHRPSASHIGSSEIWLAFSNDLKHWGEHSHLLGIRPGSWDSARIGAGAPPVRTPEGWLAIYHGAKEQDNTYYLGAVLLDLDEPTKVLARSREPIMSPQAPYEQTGFFSNVVFACGVVPTSDGKLRIYYGAADEVTAVAEITIDEVMDSLV